MFLWLVVAILTSIFIGLIAYSFPYSSEIFRPGSDFILSLTGQIGAMIVEIIAIVKLSAYFADRKWRPVRTQIRDVIWADFMNVIKHVNSWHHFHKNDASYYRPPEVVTTKEGWIISRPTPASDLNRLLYDLQKIEHYLEENNTRENLQFVTPGFTPTLASQVGKYLTNRESLKYYISNLMKKITLMLKGSSLTDLSNDNQNYVAEKLALLVARADSDFARCCRVNASISPNTAEDNWEIVDTLNDMVRAAIIIDPELESDLAVRNYIQHFFDHAEYLSKTGKDIREDLNTRYIAKPETKSERGEQH